MLKDKVVVIGLGYDEALCIMKKTHQRAQRAGWNGKGMWICPQLPGMTMSADQFWNYHTKTFAEQNGGKAEVLPYMIMKTADNKILMGWLASQTDMLANDWQILDYEKVEDKE